MMPVASSGQSASVAADELILAREARGLYWSLVARLVFVAIFAVLALLHLLRLINPGIAAETDADAAAVVVVQLVAAVFILFFMRLARRQSKLAMAGFGAVVLDLSLVSLLPVIWYNNLPLPDGSPAFLMKNELALIAIVFVVVNTLALRPIYPALVAGGFMLQQVAIAAFVLNHPKTVVTLRYVDHFYTDAVNPGATVIRIVLIAVVGGALAFLAAAARTTIHDAVVLEVANAEIRERQAEMLLEGKMTALSDLVAGVAHEVNTPLGAVGSAVDTAERAAGRLAELATQAGADVGRAEKFLEISVDSTATAQAGLGRINRVVGSLMDFSRLDEALLQRVDLHDGLESTLGLIDRDKIGAVNLVKDFSELPPLLCRPKELNQVFMTILVNAFEALQGEGELRISTDSEDGNLIVEIADTGPGMAGPQLEELFELRFTAKSGTMSMGLGLPTAHRIVQRHGGSLTARSSVGKGSVFTITLPLETTFEVDGRS